MSDSEHETNKRAVYLYRSEKYSEALVEYKKLCSLGNIPAHRIIGWMYLLGEGVETDTNIAVGYFKEAYKSKDLEAGFALGRVAERKREFANALKFYQDTFCDGFAASGYRLGRMYEFGHGVDRSFNKAKRLYWTSFGQGNLWSLRRYAILNMHSLNPFRLSLGVVLFLVFFAWVVMTTVRNSEDVSLLK